MLSMQITDIKNFMNHLLSKDTFDKFYCIEASIKMGFTYQINGQINRDFYDSDTLETLPESHCFWKEVRPLVFQIIKGKRLPLQCKIILGLPDSSLEFLLKQISTTFQKEDIEGLFFNILYDKKGLLLTSGISYRTFSLDKSLEYAFEESMGTFLNERGIC